MSGTISIAAEGPDAPGAIDDLFATTALVGRTEADARIAERDGGALLVVAAVAGIGAAVPTVVNGILEWRDRWSRRGSRRGLNVVIEDAEGNRVLLDRASPEEIAAVLRNLPLEPPR